MLGFCVVRSVEEDTIPNCLANCWTYAVQAHKIRDLLLRRLSDAIGLTAEKTECCNELNCLLVHGQIGNESPKIQLDACFVLKKP